MGHDGSITICAGGRPSGYHSHARTQGDGQAAQADPVLRAKGEPLLAVGIGASAGGIEALNEEHVTERFTGIGPVEFLAKPYEAADLLARVDAAGATNHADAG